jgi:preprotein translocase subunit SecE
LKIVRYIEETVDELLYKVSWPSWEDLQSSAIVVAISSFMIAFMIFFMDYVFGNNSGNAIWGGVLGYYYDMF